MLDKKTIQQAVVLMLLARLSDDPGWLFDDQQFRIRESYFEGYIGIGPDAEASGFHGCSVSGAVLCVGYHCSSSSDGTGSQFDRKTCLINPRIASRRCPSLQSDCDCAQ